MKRNQIMITALALMIAIAGYLQFAGKNLEDDLLSTGAGDEINQVDSGGVITDNYTAEDLQEMDSQTILGKYYRRFGKNGRVHIRDMVRKVAFGVNFAIVGIESQEMVDYAMPLRCMVYDAGEYEKQADKIRRKLRKSKGLSVGEYRCISDRCKAGV